MTIRSLRKGLVVGARWLALGEEQGHITEAADLLSAALFDPALGACEPAVDGVKVVHDPTLDKLDVHLTQAFAAASRADATLVICLVGHGYRTSTGGPYYFVPSDHPGEYAEAERHGYPLATRIPALDAEHSGARSSKTASIVWGRMTRRPSPAVTAWPAGRASPESRPRRSRSSVRYFRRR